VIGGTVNVTASGNISGLVVSRQNSTISAAENFNGTVLSGGTANLAAGGTVSGVVIGISGVTATGSQGVSATLLSQNVSVNGGTAASTLGTSAAPTAAATSAAAAANDSAQQQVAAPAPRRMTETRPTRRVRTGRLPCCFLSGSSSSWVPVPATCCWALSLAAAAAEVAAAVGAAEVPSVEAAVPPFTETFWLSNVADTPWAAGGSDAANPDNHTGNGAARREVGCAAGKQPCR